MGNNYNMTYPGYRLYTNKHTKLGVELAKLGILISTCSEKDRQVGNPDLLGHRFVKTASF